METPTAIHITIETILNYRIGLEQITNPSKEINQAKANLDEHILRFTRSLITKEMK